jgi:hypothetical protein
VLAAIVVEVLELLTMVLGPNALLVPARIDLDDSIAAGRVERTTSDLSSAIRDTVPDVTEVFLDATPGRDATERERRDARIAGMSG